MKRIWVVGPVLALAAMLLFSSGCNPVAATPGGRIFASGQGHGGAIARSTMGGPWVSEGMACANCHGNGGKGTPVGPDISRAVLGVSHTITHKPSAGSAVPQPVTEGPWTAQQTVAVVRSGMTPEGNRLGGRMPRWRLDAQDASALAGFLAGLK